MTELQLKDKNEAPKYIANLRLVNLKRLKHTGIYSTVWRGELDNAVHAPVIIKRHLIDPSTIDKEIVEWQKYRRAIEAYKHVTGVTIPKSLAYEVIGQGIYFVEESIKTPDVSKLLHDKNIDRETKYKIIANLVRALSLIPQNNTKTEFMIDGKPSNFCFRDKRFVYVDTFPAHYRTNSKTDLLHPRSDHISMERNIAIDSFVTGNMYGILGRLLGTLWKEHPDLWGALGRNNYMIAAIETLHIDLKDFVRDLLESDVEFMRLMYGSDIRDSKTIYDLLKSRKPIVDN